MPNDAKLGLVLGVVLVIVVAVVYFRKDLLSTDSPDTATPSAVAPGNAAGQRGGRGATRATPARSTSLRRHVVGEGETLYTLAVRYYGDGDRFIDLYQANRAVLKSPDTLPKGTELVIPELPEESTPDR